MPNEQHRSEVLRYLGYRGQELTPELLTRIDEVYEHCVEVARPSAVTRAFGVREVEHEAVMLEGCTLQLTGHDIAAHLQGAVEVVLMAVTLGTGIDRELRRLGVCDPLGQAVFDASATTLVEQLADKTEAQVRAHAAERGLYCSWRFSPGYGDLSLEVQPAFLAAVDAARRLGITLTTSNLMVPTKSVTAIIGLHREPQPGLASSCAVCSLAEFCELRKQGITCGR